MMNCHENWRSVRKVKYFDDIYYSIRFFYENEGAIFDENDYISGLIKNREKRNVSILKHHSRLGISTRIAMRKSKFSVTMSDTKTFYKNVNVADLSSNTVICGLFYDDVTNIEDAEEIKKLITINILNSKYGAYYCFINYLIDNNEFIISSEYKKRDKSFREYLKSWGINTDVPSFYTIRDLFYELSIINWYVDDDDDMIIYPVINMENDSDKIEFRYKDINISEFLRELVETYLNSTQRRFNVEKSIIEIRDVICYKYKISDYAFKQLLIKSVKNKDNYIIQLNFGRFLNPKRNYGLKMMTLPSVYEGRLGLYIRIKDV
jgi:hypothetical protein